MPLQCHNPPSPSTCKTCERYTSDAGWAGEYDRLLGLTGRRVVPLLPCEHEGNVLERCHKCNGEARHVRECDLHGMCTRGYVSDKVQSCDRCQDHTSRRGDNAGVVDEHV